MTPDLIILLIWVACGVAAYGAIFADFQGAFPLIASESAASNRIMSATVSILGPFSLLVVVLFTWVRDGRPFKHGWKL